MITVPEYKHLKLIHQGLYNLVYTGTRHSDGLKVVLRQLRPELASPQLLTRHRQEFELLQKIDSAFIIKPIELIDGDESPILVTEAPEGTPLESVA